MIQLIVLVTIGIVALDTVLWLLWARPTSLSAAEANLKVSTVNIVICIVATVARIVRAHV